MKKYLLVFLAFGFIITSCKKNDDDDEIIEKIAEDPKEDPVVKSVADYPSQDFMWKVMNAEYFWQADVADLADSKDDVDADYAEFLSTEANPGDFFYKICNNHINVVGEQTAVDRFSGAVENYKDLVNSLAGISKSNGLEYQLYLFQGSDDVYGVVTYVARDSDASTTDIKRGDFFVGVDGQTLNRNNFGDLLFGDNDTYTLTMADLANNTIEDNGTEIELTKVENFSENPILVSEVIEENGIKIGYLMYNSFLAAYDEELNEVFGTFKAANIDELVLDFRYNGGGRVSSVVQIASSIYGTKTDEVLLRARFNDKVQGTYSSAQLETNFSDKTIAGSAINELSLTRLFVLTTGATASSSELVINGLEPYIDVVQIGETSRGKNEFSTTFVDDPDGFYFYNPAREGNINPNNQWGIQPLWGRNENADGFSDYTSGLVPDFELEEDIANLGVLGDASEPLFALALSKITGDSSKSNRQPQMTAEVFSSSLQFKRINNTALMDGLIKK